MDAVQEKTGIEGEQSQSSDGWNGDQHPDVRDLAIISDDDADPHDSSRLERCLLDRQHEGEDRAVSSTCEGCAPVNRKQFTPDDCSPGSKESSNCIDQESPIAMETETETIENGVEPRKKSMDADAGCILQENGLEIQLNENDQESPPLPEKESLRMKDELELCNVKQGLFEVRRLEQNYQRLSEESKDHQETLSLLTSRVDRHEETIERIFSEQSLRMDDLDEKVRQMNEGEDLKSNGFAHGSIALWNKSCKEDLELSLQEAFQRLDRLERENKELKTTLDVVNRGLSTIQKDYRGLTVTMVQHREEIGALDRRTSFLGESKSEPCLAAPMADSGWVRFRRRVVRFFGRSRHRGEGSMSENLHK